MRSFSSNNRRRSQRYPETRRRDPIVLRHIPYGYSFDEKLGHSRIRISSGFRILVVAVLGVILSAAFIVASIAPGRPS